MILFLLVLALLSVTAAVATVVQVRRDGYGRTRTEPPGTRSGSAGDRARVL